MKDLEPDRLLQIKKQTMKRRTAVRASLSALIVVASIIFNVASVSGEVTNTLVQVTEPLGQIQDTENVPSPSPPLDATSSLPTEPLSPGIDEGRLTVRLVVQYDSKPEETTFLIRKGEQGDVIYRGPGDYEPAPNEKWFTMFNEFPLGNFTFEIFDAAGDGMSSGTVLGSYELWQLYPSGAQKRLAAGNHNFQSSATVHFQTRSDELPQTLTRLPVVEILLQFFTLTELETYVNFAEIAPKISGGVTVSMTMPWNFGFQRFTKPLVEKLRNKKWNAHLRNLLEYHMFDGDLTDVSFDTPVNLTMKNNEETLFALSDSENPRVQVNGVNTLGSYDAVNGFVFVLDRVLIPAWVNRNLYDVAKSEVTTLTSLIVRAGLDVALQDPLQNLTIFAPDNEAFDSLGNAALDLLTSDDGLELLNETLKYHVAIGGPFSSLRFTSEQMKTLQGGGLEIVPGTSLSVLGVFNQASITMYDKVANNGIMHIVNRVILLGPLDLSESPSGAPTVSPSTDLPSSSPSHLPTTPEGDGGSFPDASCGGGPGFISPPNSLDFLFRGTSCLGSVVCDGLNNFVCEDQMTGMIFSPEVDYQILVFVAGDRSTQIFSGSHMVGDIFTVALDRARDIEIVVQNENTELQTTTIHVSGSQPFTCNNLFGAHQVVGGVLEDNTVVDCSE